MALQSTSCIENIKMSFELKSFRLARQSTASIGGFQILAVHKDDVKESNSYYQMEKCYPDNFLEHCLHKQVPLPHGNDSLGMVMLQCAEMPAEALVRFADKPNKNQNMPFRVASFIKFMQLVHSSSFFSDIDIYFKDETVLTEKPFIGFWTSVHFKPKTLQPKCILVDDIHPRLQLQLQLTASPPVYNHAEIEAQLIYLDPQNNNNVVASLKLPDLQEFISTTADFLASVVPYLMNESLPQQLQSQQEQEQHRRQQQHKNKRMHSPSTTVKVPGLVTIPQKKQRKITTSF